MPEEQLVLPILPPDEEARARIRTDLATTLFVEAGAGSGKTTALVSRVLALVRAGVTLGDIAAITFTEKAGTELRDRLRHELEGGGPAYCDALDALDGAAIGTLHAFAQRLLSENPVEARLPPRVEVLDEVTSGLEFERRWAAFRDHLLSDTELERTILLFLAAGPREDALRVLAMAFDDNWDLVAERVPAVAPDPPSIAELIAPAVASLREACERIHECAVATDSMVKRLTEIAQMLEDLDGAPTEYDVIECLGNAPSFKVDRCGDQRRWGDLPALRSQLSAAGGQLAAARSEVTTACARRLAAAIRRFTLSAAEERRAAGQLEYHDLLVLARSLVSDPVVAARLHERYRYLLLDEFQDTDPIQVELAVRIAAVADSRQADRAWTDVEVRPGQLFVVGDPKQSIYRFRRADIGMFLLAKRRFGVERGATVELTANFRTGAPIIDWVNAAFGALMAPVGAGPAAGAAPPADGAAPPAQPAYVALHAVRSAGPVGPPVAVVGADPHPRGTPAAEVRRAEAVSVAAAITEALGDGWSVADPVGGWRPARLGDITILVPARTSLPFLEDALDEAGIPFRAESSSLVYATRAVRDLLMVLRAVDDPTDGLRTVAALRTPLLGCGDDDLFRFRVERHGRWSFLSEQPATVPAEDPVAEGLRYLGSVFATRQWAAPSELLMRIAEERRAFELGFAEGRPRDVWRRLRFVIDQARAWSDATGGSVREYLHWVDEQTAEGSRVSEAVLPETDDDAVRVMTIHAAKGLEFPITIVSGLSAVPGGRRAAAQVVFPPVGEPGYRFGAAVETSEFSAWTPIDEQMEFHERIRLLYVACTRARDHLVVSIHRKERVGTAAPRDRTNAELIAEAAGTGPELRSPIPGPRVAAPIAPAAPIIDFDAWQTAHRRALARARRPGTVSATALTTEGTPDPSASAGSRADLDAPAGSQADQSASQAEPSPPAATQLDPGLAKRPRDMDLPPWLKGRYGTAVGRAVHGVLQTIDLATGAGLEAAVAAQCEAEAIPERAEDVVRLARSALGSPAVVVAAASPHWREVYACTPVGDRLLEGYVDLLYRTPDGLVVVDYKTAASTDPDELARRLLGYRIQGASSALAVAAATAEPVGRVTFLFLTPAGAVELDLPDLAAAIEDVRRQIAAGEEREADQPAASTLVLAGVAPAISSSSAT
ncbi:MAG: hypothetical protein NVS1B12_04170 [Acidimicrobiales bacterium]